MPEPLKINSQFEPSKDFGVNTMSQTSNKRKNKQVKNNEKHRHRQNFSVSPDIFRQKSPINPLFMNKADAYYKPVVYPVIKNNDKRSISPKLAFAEIQANLPRSDGSNIIVHKYALPQALIPIRTPTIYNKTPNILEESVFPKSHPIIKKGFSGWKISLNKLYLNQLRKKIFQ